MLFRSEVFVNKINSLENQDETILEDLLLFFADRMRIYLKDNGFSHDIIEALLVSGSEDDLVRLVARAKALKEFIASHEGHALLGTYRRAANILQAEEKKDGCSYDSPLDKSLLSEASEKNLAEALNKVTQQVDLDIEAENFNSATSALATLQDPLDLFFASVTVNHSEEKIRSNRLFLLSRIRGTMEKVAQFSHIKF